MNGYFETRVGSDLAEKIESRRAVVGIIGLGYVGLPLAAACVRGGFRTRGFDVDAGKISILNGGSSYIDAVGSEEIARYVLSGRFNATSEFAELSECDVIIICVPTPLSRHREPDLHYIEITTECIARAIREGQLIVLESTTYPGTTDEVVKPILEKTGLKSGSHFFLGFSPEREDPGNTSFKTATIPKIVAGDGPAASFLVETFYAAVVDKVVVVSSPKVSEAVKITENVFRAVNIALVNELKVIYEAMGIDVWEVIDAAATKPFGYMPFYPGPGLGGHCIPIDPFYLTWKSREYGLSTRFIELAGEINVSMPRYVIGRLEGALDRFANLSLGSARILMLGLAYKKNVSDIRESPSLELMELLERRQSKVDYHDPLVPIIPPTREHSRFAGRKSVDLTAATCEAYDAIVVATDHDSIDYQLISKNSKIIIDTRNVFARKGILGGNIVKS
ncbi:nucleotide sugar dehydrogenase [Mesorhizobium sp. M1163]|uniref:nucleotide sugar dehydrogenase n=1 Tax=Mesorhizobium sp. M1163 TaxID=2957065 RepID=UPI00333DB025